MNEIVPHTPLLIAIATGWLVTLLAAGAVLRFHHFRQRRQAEAARQASALAGEFARYLGGLRDGRELRQQAGAARYEVLWLALEAFSDNIAGEEWRALSSELAGLPGVTREIGRLDHAVAWRRALAARHLGLVNLPGAFESLRRAMRRGPEPVTLAAALSLARAEDIPSLEWLLGRPEATASFGRFQLVALLKRFGPRGNGALRRAMAADEVEAPIHLAAVEVLGLRRNLRARRRLEDLLLARSVETRIVATRALGRIGAGRSVPALQYALGDPAWQVRAQAARALAGLRPQSALRYLIPCLNDPSWWVRRHSAYALAGLGAPGQAALEQAVEHSDDRFAREMAREALQALEWERESPGGLLRVA